MAVLQPIYSIKYVLYIIKIIGAFPINLTNLENKNKTYKIYTSILILCYVSLYIFAFPDRDDEKETHYIVSRLVGVLYLLTFCIILLTSMLGRQKLKNIIKNVIDFDENCQEFNINLNNRRIFKVSLILISISGFILSVIFISDIFILRLYLNFNYLLRFLVIYIPAFSMTYYLIFISVISCLLHQRFKEINNSLNDATAPIMAVLVKSKLIVNDRYLFKRKKFVDNLKNLKYLNELLRNITNEILSYFSFPMLFCFVAIFVDITVQVFYLIFLIRFAGNNDDDIENVYVWQAGLSINNYILNYLVVLFYIVYYFHKTKYQVCI